MTPTFGICSEELGGLENLRRGPQYGEGGKAGLLDL